MLSVCWVVWNRTFSEEKVPKRLSASIRYALGSAVLRLWVGFFLFTKRTVPSNQPETTAKNSMKFAIRAGEENKVFSGFFRYICRVRERKSLRPRIVAI